jgi:hypothetical protein
VASEIKGTTRGSKTAAPLARSSQAGTKSQLRKGDFSSREGENDKAHYLPAALYVYIYYLFCAPAHLILREKKRIQRLCLPLAFHAQQSDGKRPLEI